MANEKADGSITIETELDSKGFEAGCDALMNAINTLARKAKTLNQALKNTLGKPLNVDADTGKAQSKLDSLKAKASAVKDEMKKLEAEMKSEADLTGFNVSDSVLDTSKVEKQINSIVSSVEKLEPTFQRAMSGNNSAISSFESKSSALEKKIDALKSKMQEIGNTKFPTEEYAAVCGEIDKVDQKIQLLITRQEKLNALGVSGDSNQWKSLQYDLETACAKYQELIAKKQQLESTGQAFQMGSATSQYAQLDLVLASASNRLSEMQAKTEGLRSGASGARGVMQRIANAAGIAAKNIGKAAVSAAGKLVGGLKSAASSMVKTLFHSKSLNNSFGSLISNAKRFAIGLLGAEGVFTLLRKAVNAYMEQNQQLSNTLTACWTGIGNILGPIIEKIVNLVAQAVSFVLSFLKLFGVVGKSTTKAIGSAGSAAKKETDELKRQLASFDELNVLSDSKSGSGGGGGGSGGGTAALPDVEVPDWAKLIAEQLKKGEWEAAAKTLADQLNKMVDSVDWTGLGDKIGYYLNGALTFLATFIKEFDWKNLGSHLGEMMNHVLDGVDWSNLGVILTAKWAIVLKTLDGFFSKLSGKSVSKALTDFMNGTVDAADWVGISGSLSKNISNVMSDIDAKGIGNALSRQMRTALQSIIAAIDNFDWAMLGKKIGDFLNGIDWEGTFGDLGTLLGNLANAAIDTLSTAIETSPWKEMGSGLANGINKIFTTVNWENVSGLLSDGIVGVLDTASGFIENFSWPDFYSSIRTLISGVKWGEIASSIFEFLGAAIGSCLSSVVNSWKTIADMWGDAFESVKTYFQEKVEAAGGNIIEGVFNGIKDALKNIGSWIYEHIFRPFIDGFKKAFGINSPSTVMAEQGRYIIDGLVNGIGDVWSKVKQKFIDFYNRLKTWFDEKKAAVVAFGSNLINNIKTGIGEIWTKTKEKFSTFWANLNAWFAEIKGKFKTFGTDAIDKLKSGIGGIWGKIKEKFVECQNGLSGWFTDRKNNFKSFGTNAIIYLKSGIGNIWSKISERFSGFKEKLSAWFTNRKNDFKNAGTSMITNFKSGIGNIWNTVKQKFIDFWSSLKSYIGSKMLKLGVTWDTTSTLGKALTKIGLQGMPKLSFYAKGGIVTKPTLSMIGEAGKEAVIPLQRNTEWMRTMARAIANEIKASTFTLQNIAGKSAFEISFPSSISDGLMSISDALKAVANSPIFHTPAIANSVVPYKTAATVTESESKIGQTIEASNAELGSVIIQSVSNATASIVRAIQDYSGTTVNVDVDSLTTGIVNEINLRTRMNGKSPLLI